MNLIKSFTVDHNKLQKGVYVSRIDGDVVTYDIRMKLPNGGDYLDNGAMHTFEHLFATFVRNGRFEKYVVYVGPMGCRTGFYLLMRNNVSKDDVLQLLKECFLFISKFNGEIPGTKKEQCGNYLEHDLAGAKEIAVDMLKVLKDWSADKFSY